MGQPRSGSAEPDRIAKLTFFWEDHKFVIILVSCLVFPILFVPVWILAFLVFRVRKALGLSRQHRPSGEFSDAADIPEQSLADRRSKMTTADQGAFPVGAFLHGVAAFVGVMLCVLGWQVIGLASGQAGGGIALLMGFSLFASGSVATIVGLFGLARRLG